MTMVIFFRNSQGYTLAVQAGAPLSDADSQRLVWLFEGAVPCAEPAVEGWFVGPRREMITPWSSAAVEITQNMNIGNIGRIEEFFPVSGPEATFDPMLQKLYHGLDQEVFTVKKTPEPILYIEDIAAYNQQEGLALSDEEVAYLEGLSRKLQRRLTDSEIFGFSQVNSEHCRHKIFNGTFIIDGQQRPSSLFGLIKRTSQTHPNRIVSAYKDNCAFLEGPEVNLFVPGLADRPGFFGLKQDASVLSLKAETHNFPTTVEPFNGAATGSGGEIRDRMGGGKGSFPLAGTAVYMTSYPRFEGENRQWEQSPPRPWLYQSPRDILIKASNGASDYGNKFGQPLICGSLLTLEHTEARKKFGFDKVIMLAGGVGMARKRDSLKGHPAKGDKIILLGGDNYRIGMGGGAVSSVDTGQYGNAIELNAVQRANAEMEKRVLNAIRALAESEDNPIVSIHDHGAGGHLNCLSELVEETGGRIDMSQLPIGDPTLSAKEIVGNESQERMGFIVPESAVERVRAIAARERAPFYVIGEATGDHRFTFEHPGTGDKPIDLELKDMFGNAPKTLITGESLQEQYAPLAYEPSMVQEYVQQVLQIEAVACKDWLTNKVDRSVTGRVALQQTAGEIQLPLNNMAIMALDYQGGRGIATSIGHAPAAALIHPGAGSRLAITEALTNLVWAPLEGGIKGISLSANWMWPCKNEGEDARLYEAVEAASDFCIALGINIPTGKDSLSMTQKYPDGEKVLAPGSVLISSIAEVTDIRRAVRPVMKLQESSVLLYVGLSGGPFALGGSSFAQVLNGLGTQVPDVADPAYLVRAFAAVQDLVRGRLLLSGHDVSAGGLITTLLEMTFANKEGGFEADLSVLGEPDLIRVLFSENPAWVLQVKEAHLVRVLETFDGHGITALTIGKPIPKRIGRVFLNGVKHKFDIESLRDAWFRTSYLFDRLQSGPEMAEARKNNYKIQPLSFTFPEGFTGTFSSLGLTPARTTPGGVRAAIIREKGSNGDREMAWIMHLAGFDVRDVHMTDLISGRETLDDIQLIVFVGGFSNSDVLGSAKGWAGAFLYNEKAKATLERFYARPDTLSLGVCNGCQLMMHLGLITPMDEQKPQMLHNDSHKFESGFVNVNVPRNYSVMLHSLSGARLGIWVAHGEGKFSLPSDPSFYHIALEYSYTSYPGNPNGSPEGVAGICSADGRHLAMMPHPERCTYPWNWPLYPEDRQDDEVTPWVIMFTNAYQWILKHHTTCVHSY